MELPANLADALISPFLLGPPAERFALPGPSFRTSAAVQRRNIGKGGSNVGWRITDGTALERTDETLQEYLTSVLVAPVAARVAGLVGQRAWDGRLLAAEREHGFSRASGEAQVSPGRDVLLDVESYRTMGVAGSARIST
ncbi:MAG: hypothetical protein E6J71_10265 [Deltaproteobacteria bacterium]|nr:MAG: hypothetical protein E6J71_10265 [Deltaproteobacteria bacterium]